MSNIKPKEFIIIASVTFIVAFAGLITTQPAQALPVQVCDEGEHIGNPNCEPSITDEVSPTEDIQPTVEPTLEVTETPVVSPTAEVTQTPSSTGGGHVDVSDGLSDGRHTAPDNLGCAVHECKTIPNGPPNTGRGR